MEAERKTVGWWWWEWNEEAQFLEMEGKVEGKTISEVKLWEEEHRGSKE